MNRDATFTVSNSDILTTEKREQLVGLLRAYFDDPVSDVNGVLTITMPAVARPANVTNHVGRFVEIVHEEVSPSLAFSLTFTFSAQVPLARMLADDKGQIIYPAGGKPEEESSLERFTALVKRYGFKVARRRSAYKILDTDNHIFLSYECRDVEQGRVDFSQLENLLRYQKKGVTS